MTHDMTIDRSEPNHWRWVCSCGAKGIRLAYRSHVVRLADAHLKQHTPHPVKVRQRQRVLAALLRRHNAGRCDAVADYGIGDAADYRCEHNELDVAAQILDLLDSL